MQFRSCVPHSEREAIPHSLQRWRGVFFHKMNIGHTSTYDPNDPNRKKMGSNYKIEHNIGEN